MRSSLPPRRAWRGPRPGPADARAFARRPGQKLRWALWVGSVVLGGLLAAAPGARAGTGHNLSVAPAVVALAVGTPGPTTGLQAALAVDTSAPETTITSGPSGKSNASDAEFSF